MNMIKRTYFHDTTVVAMFYNRTWGTEMWEGWKVQMDPYITRGRAVGKINDVCVANILHQLIFQHYVRCWKFIQINGV